MFGTGGAWSWGIGLIAFALGVGAGFLLGAVSLRRARREAAERELEALRARFDAYRGRVDESFRRTSELFEGMTRQYREVYEHLAESAEALCSPDAARAAVELPEVRRLGPDAAVRTPPAGEGVPADAAPVDGEDSSSVGDIPAPVPSAQTPRPDAAGRPGA